MFVFIYDFYPAIMSKIFIYANLVCNFEQRCFHLFVDDLVTVAYVVPFSV